MKNPFNYNRVNGDWTEEEIRIKFEKPRQFDDFEERGHRFLLGSTASGKTHVLRYLSLAIRLKESKEIPPYIGVYMPFADSVLNPFKDAYRESGEWELFGHYFNLVVGERTAWTIQQLSLKTEAENKLVQEAAEIFGFEENIKTLDGLKEELKKAQTNLCQFVNETQSLDKEGFQGFCTDTPQTVKELMQRWRAILVETIGQDVCFYLLVDGYERFKELCIIVNALLEYENCTDFCMKIATTRIVDLVGEGVKGISPKRLRDYRVVSLDYIGDLEGYKTFLKSVAEKRLAYARDHKQKPNLCTDIERLLSSEATQAEKQLVGYLDDQPMETKLPMKLKELKRQEHPRDTQKSKRKNLYYGFDSYAGLSNGVVTSFLQLCHEAFAIALEKGIDVWNGEAIPAEVQAEAALEVSREAFNAINSCAGTSGDKLCNLVYNLAGTVDKRFEDDSLPAEQLECLGVEVSDIDVLASDGEMAEMLKRGLQESVLFTQDRIEFEQLGAIPNAFTISAIYAPRFGISYRHRFYLPVTSLRLSNWARKETFPGIPKPMAEPEISRQMLSMPNVLRGFLAISFGTEYEKMRESTKSAFRAQLKLRLSPGTQVADESLFYDAQEMPGKLGGDINQKSLEGIRQASFVVADIAVLSSDVYMEVGMAHGLMKPCYLVWNLEVGSYNPNAIPEWLRTLECSPCSLSQGVARRKLANRIIKDVQSLPLLQVCPAYKDKNCQFSTDEKPRSVFILYGTQVEKNEQVFKSLQALLSERLGVVEVQIPSECRRSWLCSICYPIRRCQYCIIDVTDCEMDRGIAWACGLAHAIKSERLLRTYQQGRGGEKPTMSQVLKPSVWEPSQDGADIFNTFRDTFQIK